MAPEAVATFINAHGHNDVYWRCDAPARAVGARTELIPPEELNDVLMYPHDVPPLRWWVEMELVNGEQKTIRYKRDWKTLCLQQPVFHLNSFKVTIPDLEGTAVWIRPDFVRATLAAQMREDGHRTVAELDDNYVADANLNITLRIWEWGEEQIKEHLKSCCSMDAIAFSTEYLRDIYDFEIRRRRKQMFEAPLPPLPELHVCHNNVDAEDWPEVEEYDGPVRVGWMGSPSHIWDVNLAWGALLYAKRAGAETWMIGWDPVNDPQTLAKASGETLSEKAWDFIHQWEKVEFEHIPWRPPERYERFALPLDIGLCPLMTNKHTLGKSDVKFLEYTISGAATIAQNNPVYNRTIIHGETGLLAGSPSEFVDCVKLLMEDEKLRTELVENAQQYVREERGGKQLREEWMAVIDG